MRPPLAVAVAMAFLAVAVFGFGHAIGAWDAPAVAEPGTTTEPVARAQDDAPEKAKETPRKRRKKDRGEPRQAALPAPVVGQLDELCRRSRVHAERLTAGGPPTSKQALRRFLERLERVSARYNVEALEILAPHADDRRARALARLFEREEELFGRLRAAVPGLDSPAGRARFERRLAALTTVGFDQARALVALGARECDPATIG